MAPNGKTLRRKQTLSASSIERRNAALVPYYFKRGQSGNPGGRTAEIAEVQTIARRASPRAIKRLVELIEDDDPRVALLADEKVLKRVRGKPKEQTEDGPRALAGMSI